MNGSRKVLPREEIEEAVCSCLAQLFKQDLVLLQNDVSERAITHKLAEYLQVQFLDWNVDCEYNRDVISGPYAQKLVHILETDIREKAQAGAPADELLAYSTYPDIIVHRRATNTDNLLVIEVKKRNSTQGHNFDRAKLKAFTQSDGHNSYGYQFGVFIVLETRCPNPAAPRLAWFINGEEA